MTLQRMVRESSIDTLNEFLNYINNGKVFQNTDECDTVFT
jgi:hypothetical protein